MFSFCDVVVWYASSLGIGGFHASSTSSGLTSSYRKYKSICLLTSYRSLFAYRVQIFVRLPHTDLCSLTPYRTLFSFPRYRSLFAYLHTDLCSLILHRSLIAYLVQICVCLPRTGFCSLTCYRFFYLLTPYGSLFAYLAYIFVCLSRTYLRLPVTYTFLFAYPVRIVPRGYLDEYDTVGVHVGGGRDAAEK